MRDDNWLVELEVTLDTLVPRACRDVQEEKSESFNSSPSLALMTQNVIIDTKVLIDCIPEDIKISYTSNKE